jgi:hypothetical protein
MKELVKLFHTGFWWGNLLGIVDLEDQEVDGKITLSRVLWGLVVIMGGSEN